MQYTSHFTAGLPQLDVHTLSEDWALATALEKQRASMGSGQGSTTRTQIAQSFLSAIANSAYQTLSQTTSTSTQGVEAVA